MFCYNWGFEKQTFVFGCINLNDQIVRAFKKFFQGENQKNSCSQRIMVKVYFCYVIAIFLHMSSKILMYNFLIHIIIKEW